MEIADKSLKSQANLLLVNMRGDCACECPKTWSERSANTSLMMPDRYLAGYPLHDLALIFLFVTVNGDYIQKLQIEGKLVLVYEWHLIIKDTIWENSFERCNVLAVWNGSSSSLFFLFLYIWVKWRTSKNVALYVLILTGCHLAPVNTSREEKMSQHEGGEVILITREHK